MNEQNDEVLQLLQARGTEKSVRLVSEVLEPSTASQKYIRFEIPAKGLLQHGSRVILPISSSNATTALSMYGGIFGLIKNCTLSCDGNQICQTQRANFLMSMRDSWRDQDRRKRVGQFINGSWNAWRFNDQSLPATTGKFEIATLLKDGVDQGLRPERHRVPQTQAGGDDGTYPEYSISLKQMFPEFFELSLPLYAMKRVELFIELADNTEVAIATDGDNANRGTIAVDTANCVFVSDHLYYDQDTMNRLEALTRTSTGLVIPYSDYSCVELSLAGTAGLTGSQELEKTFNNTLGFSQSRIKHVLIHKGQQTNGTNNLAQKIGGVYCTAPDFGGSQSESVQFNINNVNYFNSPLQNNNYPRETEDVFGIMARNNYPCMTAIGSRTTGQLGEATTNEVKENELISSDVVLGSVAQNNLMASQQFIGVNFSHQRVNNGANGVLVNDAPVQFTYKKKFVADDQSDMSVKLFVCLSRLGSIHNGDFQSNYS